MRWKIENISQERCNVNNMRSGAPASVPTGFQLDDGASAATWALGHSRQCIRDSDSSGLAPCCCRIARMRVIRTRTCDRLNAKTMKIYSADTITCFAAVTAPRCLVEYSLFGRQLNAVVGFHAAMPMPNNVNAKIQARSYRNWNRANTMEFVNRLAAIGFGFETKAFCPKRTKVDSDSILWKQGRAVMLARRQSEQQKIRKWKEQTISHKIIIHKMSIYAILFTIDAFICHPCHVKRPLLSV